MVLTPTMIWPPCSDVISGTATGRIAGTAVPFTSGHGCFVVLVPLIPAQVEHAQCQTGSWQPESGCCAAVSAPELAVMSTRLIACLRV